MDILSEHKPPHPSEADVVKSVAFLDKLVISTDNKVVIHDIGKIKAFSAMHPMEIAPPKSRELPN